MEGRREHQTTGRRQERECRVPALLLIGTVFYFHLGALVRGLPHVMGSAPNAVVQASHVTVQLAKPGLTRRRVKNDRVVSLGNLRSNVLLIGQAKHHVVQVLWSPRVSVPLLLRTAGKMPGNQFALGDCSGAIAFGPSSIFRPGEEVSVRVVKLNAIWVHERPVPRYAKYV
jgi:hypothetical protein